MWTGRSSVDVVTRINQRAILSKHIATARSVRKNCVGKKTNSVNLTLGGVAVWRLFSPLTDNKSNKCATYSILGLWCTQLLDAELLLKFCDQRSATLDSIPSATEPGLNS